MTLPQNEYNHAVATVLLQVALIARKGSIEQTISAIEELDLARKWLDRVQANPHLWGERAAAMSRKYQGSEEKLLLAGVNDVHWSHDQDTHTPHPAPDALDGRGDGLPAGVPPTG